MKKLIVPPSVRRQGRKMAAGRIVKLLVYLYLAYIVVEYTYSGLKTTSFGNLSTTLFFTLIIPFIASGVPMKLIDRDWYGEIIKLELENNDPAKIDNHAKPAVSQTALVKAQDGKLYEVEIFDEGEYFSGQRERVYHVGDKVLHVRWTEYLMPVREKGCKRPTACVVCGFKSPVGTQVCRSCKCSMDIRVVNERAEK